MAHAYLKPWALWKQFLLVLLYSLPLLPLTCAQQGKVSAAQDLPQIKIPPFVASDDGQWRMAPKDYANLRYSELDQITPENIQNLHVAFTFSTGVTQGHEAANRATTSFTLVGTSADFTLSASYRPFWVMMPQCLGRHRRGKEPPLTNCV